MDLIFKKLVRNNLVTQKTRKTRTGNDWCDTAGNLLGFTAELRPHFDGEAVECMLAHCVEQQLAQRRQLFPLLKQLEKILPGPSKSRSALKNKDDVTV
jgi:hypothetical protein